MTLAQPDYEGLFKLDEKLFSLQKEVKFLEQEYGFSEKHMSLAISQEKPQLPKNQKNTKKQEPTNIQVNKTKAPLNMSSKESRYKNLPSMKVSDKEVPKRMIKPEIDSAWKDANKIKPNLMTFYNIDVYQKKYVDMKDFSGKAITLK